MAVKFPREAFAAILSGNKVALDWLASLGGTSTTIVSGGTTDLSAIEAEIAAVAAAAAAADGRAEAAQITADEASMWAPSYSLNPREVQAITTAAPPDLTGSTGIVAQTGPATYVAATLAARLSFTAGTLDVVSAPIWTTGRTLAITGDLAYTSPSLDGSGNVTAAGALATVNSNVGAFTNANITVNAKGLITAAASGSGGSGTVTTTGSPASGNLAKFSGATSITNTTVSAILDAEAGSTQGQILYRGSSAWTVLATGTAGQVLQTNGVAADPTWVTPTGGTVASGQHKYEAFGALPLAATFTGVSATNLTATDGTISLLASWTASGANTVQLFKKAAPSTPYDVYMRVAPAFSGSNVQFGLVVRNSSNGKFALFSMNASAFNLTVQEWTSTSTFSSTLLSTSTVSISPGWLRINNSGTTLTFYYSGTGELWTTIATRTIATFLGAADEIGFGGVPQSAGSAAIGSFGTTAPS